MGSIEYYTNPHQPRGRHLSFRYHFSEPPNARLKRFLTDMNGKKYIDFNAQAMCSNLGHTVPPSVIEAVTTQMKEVAMTYAVEVSTYLLMLKKCENIRCAF